MTRSDGLLQLISKTFRKYSRDPESRAYSSRHLLSAALALAAEHNDLGEVALITAETLTTLKQQDRLAERSSG
jgi:hypothetical protein